MRILMFAKRNFKEIIRDILSLLFCFAFPIFMFLLFELITSGMTEEEILYGTPQFQTSRLVSGISLFSFSFLSLFAGMVISKDRTSSFLARLRTSPMTAKDFIFGYTLPLLPIAVVQIIVSYLMGIIFGYEITANTLLSWLTMIPIMLLFISLGLLFGTLFNDKTIGGVSSIVINLAAIFSGIFMPIDNMTGIINKIAYTLPFANSLKITNAVAIGNYEDLLGPMLIVIGYTIVIMVASILVFQRKINSDAN